MNTPPTLPQKLHQLGNPAIHLPAGAPFDYAVAITYLFRTSGEQ
jgi:hypothetical protein